jgi:membrane fusion protein
MADRPEAPYLDGAPPAWAARALAWMLLALFVAGVVVMVTVHVPESVSAPFVVVATTGADPVRALHDGVVDGVLVSDAQTVAAGATLFTIGSELVGDRIAEREALGTSLGGGQARLANERTKFEGQRNADEQELRRLAERQATVRTQLRLKEQQLALAREVLVRQQRSHDEGLISWIELSRPALEVDRLAVEVEETRAEIAEAASADARLRYEMASRKAAFDELGRSVEEELARARSRKGMLDREGGRAGNAMSVTARCSGTIVRLVVRNPGTVVAASDVLAEMVCDDEVMQAELMVPQRGLALVAPDQPVKLQYDAFPYQRYGVRYATVRWISPSSSGVGDAAAFRVLADLDEQTLRIGENARPVLPGMGGRAAIIVGRRSLASYAFEPLRQMREAMAAGRPAAGRQQ